MKTRWAYLGPSHPVWPPHPASRFHHLEVQRVAHWGVLEPAEAVAGGQCSEQGPHGQAAGLWDQWQEGLPLQGHHTHHIQAILSEGACLQGARGQPGGEAWDELCPDGLGAHTPGQVGPMGAQEPELEPEEVLSRLWAFARLDPYADRPSPAPAVSSASFPPGSLP